jgi:putative endonuclease
MARPRPSICLRKLTRRVRLKNKEGGKLAGRNRQTETNMYYVYILLNEAKTRTYTGVAEDVNERLAVHNAGRVKVSRPYRPYDIIHTESFETLKEARQKERFYKSTTGRRKIKEMFFKKEKRYAKYPKQDIHLVD